MKGVVLKTIPYQESGRIVTLFTEDAGKISLLVKRLSPKNHHLQNVLSSLALSEWRIGRGRGDLYHLQDATLLDTFCELRRDFESLMTARRMIRLLLRSQPEERSVPPLFHLFVAYLTGLKQGKGAKQYALSFSCKLLRFEGVFPIYRESAATPFTDEEWEAFEQLGYATSHEMIQEIPISTSLEEKIDIHLSTHLEV